QITRLDKLNTHTHPFRQIQFNAFFFPLSLPTHTHKYTCEHTHTHMYAHICMHTERLSKMHIHTHIHIHSHTHTHTHRHGGDMFLTRGDSQFFFNSDVLARTPV